MDPDRLDERRPAAAERIEDEVPWSAVDPDRTTYDVGVELSGAIGAGDVAVMTLLAGAALRARPERERQF